jgi:hypothetical protein
LDVFLIKMNLSNPGKRRVAMWAFPLEYNKVEKTAAVYTLPSLCILDMIHYVVEKNYFLAL